MGNNIIMAGRRDSLLMLTQIWIDKVCNGIRSRVPIPPTDPSRPSSARHRIVIIINVRSALRSILCCLCPGPRARSGHERSAARPSHRIHP